MTQRRENVSIDLPGKDHLGHFQCGVVGDAPAFNDCLLDAHKGRELAQLFSAAMYDAKTNAHLMH